VPATAAVAPPICAHCSLPVPAGLVEESAELQFCCQGCRSVYQMIHQCHLDRYYALRQRDAAEPVPACTTGRAYSEYDDPLFLKLHATPLPGGLCRTEFYLQGVHCAACVWLVEKLPQLEDGAVEARLDLGKALLRVTWNPQRVALSRLAHVLDALGYPPHPARGGNARRIRTLEDHRYLIRIGVAGAAAGNAMLVAGALYAGVFGHMQGSFTLLFRWISMGLGVLALAWPGSVFFRGAWAAIKTRTPHLDLPIALGLGAGGVAGLINTLTNRGEIYFDSLNVLIFLLLVGRFLQHRRQGSADDALELLFSMTPMSARRVEAGGIQEVPISALQIGDTVEVRAGDSFPVDGTVLTGQSAVDQSLLTGESRPRAIGPGEQAAAGTVNLSGTLHVRVAATGEETRVGKLMRLVTDCARHKAPIVLLADRIGGYFLGAVLALAVGTFGWWLLRSPGHAVDHAVALLIVACPCALGLATPLAVSVSIGRAAKRSILIKGGDTLERLSRPGVIFLDKTGTITNGRTTLLSWHGPDDIKPLVAAVESHSTHPIARAFCAAFGESTVRAINVVQKMEGGIEGRVPPSEPSSEPPSEQPVSEPRPSGSDRAALPSQSSARTVTLHIGSPAFIRTQGIALPPWAQAQLDHCLAAAQTPVVVAANDAVVALAGFGDALRDDARQSLATLRAAGWHIGILSGDHPELVRRVALTLDIPETDARGGLLPEDKLAIVQAALKDSHGPVVMVGDGVNDAAALAAASVGIAVHGGAEASLAAAQVYLGRPGLGPILELITASRRSMKVIRRSLAASLCYNIFAVTLAATGLITPLFAAVLMPLSSLTVLSLALGTRTFGEGE